MRGECPSFRGRERERDRERERQRERDRETEREKKRENMAGIAENNTTIKRRKPSWQTT